MLLNVRVDNEKQGLDFANDVLKELGKNETDNLHYSDSTISISPEVRSEHVSEGPRDITIENYMLLTITVDDLDFKTQEIIKRHRNLLNRL